MLRVLKPGGRFLLVAWCLAGLMFASQRAVILFDR
jgi:hypothetical protein